MNGYDLGAVTKDAPEERLHWLVVSRRLNLKEAQKAIATDWVAAYQRYVGELRFDHYVEAASQSYRLAERHPERTTSV